MLMFNIWVIYRADPLQQLMQICHQRAAIYKQIEVYQVTMDHFKICLAKEQTESLQDPHMRVYILVWIQQRLTYVIQICMNDFSTSRVADFERKTDAFD